MLRKRSEMGCQVIENCHGGRGKLAAHFVLEGSDSNAAITLMHDDVLEPGASIGEHPHDTGEEVYFVVEGNGTMILDGNEYPIGPGDVSLCKSGHTHGIVNSSDRPMRLLVIGVSK